MHTPVLEGILPDTQQRRNNEPLYDDSMLLLALGPAHAQRRERPGVVGAKYHMAFRAGPTNQEVVTPAAQRPHTLQSPELPATLRLTWILLGILLVTPPQAPPLGCTVQVSWCTGTVQLEKDAAGVVPDATKCV